MGPRSLRSPARPALGHTKDSPDSNAAATLPAAESKVACSGSLFKSPCRDNLQSATDCSSLSADKEALLSSLSSGLIRRETGIISPSLFNSTSGTSAPPNPDSLSLLDTILVNLSEALGFLFRHSAISFCLVALVNLRFNRSCKLSVPLSPLVTISW